MLDDDSQTHVSESPSILNRTTLFNHSQEVLCSIDLEILQYMRHLLYALSRSTLMSLTKIVWWTQDRHSTSKCRLRNGRQN